MGKYSLADPSSLPNRLCSSLTRSALSTSAGTGTRSKSEFKCQNRVLEIRTSGRSGLSLRRFATASRVCLFTTTSW